MPARGPEDCFPEWRSWSGSASVFDGILEPNPEDSQHYCLLLGGGDTNDRGEGGEGFNSK